MKYKLLKAEYNKETGISTVTIQNKYGIFTGTSTLREEDEKYSSEYTGCYIAELKAVRKSYQYAFKIAKMKRDILLPIQYSTNCYDYSEYVYQTRKSLENQMADLYERIKEITSQIFFYIEKRENLLKKIRK